MNQRTVYFENADRPDTIVRKRPNVFELEYISRQCPEWKKAAPNSSYEREYYLGEGNCCLFHISEEDAKNDWRSGANVFRNYMFLSRK